ncbi:hypothetical protein H5410_049309 [Solanum commersonii]|uniref:Uncharacterized protein n=1 Tax=Solanum commersonii TaxID=4109 RepID=A0A9J5WSL2_SOLCO|nr:hypothetical protein H5410_049309 [Solanum commersonii]
MAHLQGQTSPRVGKPPILPIFMCYCPRHFMVTRNSDVWSQLVGTSNSTYLQVKTSLKAGKPPILPILMFCRLLYFMMTWNYDLWSQLVSTAKTAHLKSETSPEQSTKFYGDPKFRYHFCHKLTWTFVKTLAMEPIGRHDQNSPLTRSNEPHRR